MEVVLAIKNKDGTLMEVNPDCALTTVSHMRVPMASYVNKHITFLLGNRAFTVNLSNKLYAKISECVNLGGAQDE